MDDTRLTAIQRKQLKVYTSITPLRRAYRRALATLELSGDESVVAVAGMLGVSRQSV